ncbi:MAG: guanine nucleotide-binding protein subunit alpha [Chaenotheca gracillima]|nr:MAG: guanine nucleotide-binding protein subunit alpha [Chaenotheca gracillima]
MTRTSTVARVESTDPTSINLTRLLSRLEEVIPPPDAAGDSRLRRSSYERAKAGANLEYARTLLLRLEHESAGIKIPSKKQALQKDLLTRRDTIKRLNERLYELGQLDTEGDSSDENEEEDLLGEDEDAEAAQSTADTYQPPSSSSLRPQPSNASPSTERSNLLRSRHNPHPSQPENTATSTSAATSSSLPQTETLLSHNRSEQEDLTSSLVSMAQALKASSKAFASSLEAEKETVDRAGEGLETNVTGLQAAEKRMGMLRRMTEGKGWWGRIILYAWIAGLMFIALFIVGFLPKLRF